MGKRRKTRQEKIIAQLRRKLETKRSGEKVWVASSEPSHADEVPTTHNLPPSLPSTSTIYLKKDLIKTAALAALAISLEVVLFFLLG